MSYHLNASTPWQRIVWTVLFVGPFMVVAFALAAWSENAGFGEYRPAPVAIFAFVYWPTAVYFWHRQYPKDERVLPFAPKAR